MNNATEQEFFRCVNNYKIYSVVFKGESLSILKEITGGSEVACHNDNLPSYMFERCSNEDVKAIAKQQKKKEDLGVLANVTDEIRKLLDDNHVICHANVNRDTKGLVEYTIMLGEGV